MIAVTHYLRVSLPALLLALPLQALADDIDDLLQSLEGTYRIVPSADDTQTPLLTSHYAAVAAPEIGAHTVYWQMNEGSTQRVYRQALLVFTRGDDGAITELAYNFTDPAAVADGFLRPAVFANLTREDLRPAINSECKQAWARTAEGWHGAMPADSCRMWSERRQSWNYIGSEVLPRADALLYVERGFTEDGTMIFGQQRGEYYRMTRLSASGAGPNAAEIMQIATAAAGGDAWRLAETNLMSGDAVLYRNGSSTRADRYEMRRVYPRELPETHTGTGKFRLDAYSNEQLLFTISFDGEQMYDQRGPMTPQQAAQLAASSFGFSAVRFALTEGFALQRMADDQVDDRPCWFVQLTDPSGGKTLVGVDRIDGMLRYVGWDTPGGWHERLYSAHYTLESGFVQPGRVRLYYDGVKTADINWRSAKIGVDFAAATFVTGN